jgi:2-iminobutanoate/2-iminopropanoate deaminase
MKLPTLVGCTFVILLSFAKAQEPPGMDVRSKIITLPQPVTCDEQTTKPNKSYRYTSSRGVVYLAGMIGEFGCSPRTLAVGGFEVELEQILLNLGRTLGEMNLSHGNVLSCDVFLTDIKSYEKISSVYSELLTNGPPPMSVVEVAALPLGASIQMNCNAAYPEPRGEGLWPAN